MKEGERKEAGRKEVGRKEGEGMLMTRYSKRRRKKT